MALKKYSKCIEDCNKTLELDPKFVKAIRRRALSLMYLNRINDAANEFKRGVDMDPSDQALRSDYNDCLSVQSNLKRYEEAIKESNYDEALLCINQVVSKMPDIEELKLRKVECLARSGNTEQAQKLL